MVNSINSSVSSWASSLFSKLDTSNKGYFEKSDLASALSKLDSSSSNSSASVDDVFTSLDSDGDGKVTQSELSSSLQNLANELNSQYDASRMAAAMGQMPPPPPPQGGKDEGFTKDELTSIAGSTSDSNLSNLMSTLASNFSAADTNGDGKVSAEEAMAYQESASSSTSATTTDSTASTGGVHGHHHGHHQDEGLTQDQMSSIASSTSDSNLANLMSTLASNFSAADTNGDGKVTREEAMAYQQSASTSTSATTTASTASTASSASSDAEIMKRIMDLVHAYGRSGSNTTTSFSQSA